MFERFRLAGSLNYFLRCTKLPEPLRQDMERVFKPFLPQFAKRMRQDKLSGDQAALAMVTAVIAEISLDKLLAMRADGNPRLFGFKAFFLLCDGLWKMKPEIYGNLFKTLPEKTFYILSTTS